MPYVTYEGQEAAFGTLFYSLLVRIIELPTVVWYRSKKILLPDLLELAFGAERETTVQSVSRLFASKANRDFSCVFVKVIEYHR